MAHHVAKSAFSRLESELARHYGEMCWEAIKTDVGTFQLNIGKPTVRVSTVLGRNVAGAYGALHIVYWDRFSRIRLLGDLRKDALRKICGSILTLANVDDNKLKLSFDNRGAIVEIILNLSTKNTHGVISITSKGNLFSCVDGGWCVDRIDR